MRMMKGSQLNEHCNCSNSIESHKHTHRQRQIQWTGINYLEEWSCLDRESSIVAVAAVVMVSRKHRLGYYRLSTERLLSERKAAPEQIVVTQNSPFFNNRQHFYH